MGNKIIIFLITSAILSFFMLVPTEALTIREGIDRIDEEFVSENSMLFILGSGKNSQDLSGFISLTDIFLDNYQQYNIKPGSFVLDSDITEVDMGGKNLLILGGPCANKFWTKFSDETCDSWPYAPKQAVVKIKENNRKIVLLAAGTNARDTFIIAQQLSDYKNQDIFNEKDEIVYNANYEEAPNRESLCDKNTIDFKCHVFFEDFLMPMKIGNNLVKIGVAKIYPESNSIDLQITGEVHNNVKLGDSFYLEGGSYVVFDRFNFIFDQYEPMLFFSEPAQNEFGDDFSYIQDSSAKKGKFTSWTVGDTMVYTKDMKTSSFKLSEVSSDSFTLVMEGETKRYMVNDIVELDNGKSFKVNQIFDEELAVAVEWLN